MFEAADNLSLAHSFLGAPSHGFLGPGITTIPDHHDAINSGIGLAVAAAVEPMPVGLPGRSRYRIDPTERGEISLRAEALWDAPHDREMNRRSSYAEADRVVHMLNTTDETSPRNL